MFEHLLLPALEIVFRESLEVPNGVETGIDVECARLAGGMHRCGGDQDGVSNGSIGVERV
jgi:hypothetical protein